MAQEIGNIPASPLAAGWPERRTVPTAPLPDPIGETIETIIALRAKAEQNVSPHQRWVETMTEFFGRPAFLYGTILAILLWLIPNALPPDWGIPRFDPPPYEGLDKTLGIVSLIMTAAVLVRQSRQEMLAEQRAQLNLQLDLLTEQKIAKLIALLEELRRDLPNVQNRYDAEAEVMQKAVDPHTVLETLEETLNEELIQLQRQVEVDAEVQPIKPLQGS
ncbi:MAG: DUF1003 domain-containing protein [Elainella sp.]